MKKTIGIIMLAIAGLMILNVGLISAHESNPVSGIVTDGTTGAPIEGAAIVLAYTITGLLAGAQTFIASAAGYESETVGIEVSDEHRVSINFTLQSSGKELKAEELEVEQEKGKSAGTRRGYVGIFATIPTTGATTVANFGAVTAPVTGAGTAALFMVKTKRGEIEIQNPSEGLESITRRFESSSKTTGRREQIPTDGDRVVVLVEFVDQGDGGLVKVALKIIVKPTKPLKHIVGTVVSSATDQNGVRTISIMQANGTVKEMQLGPDAELPEVGEVVTAFQGRSRAGEPQGGPPVAKGLVRAEKVRQRLEGFLEDLLGGDGEETSAAAEKRAKRVAKVAAILEKHASKQVEILQRVSQNSNLPPQAAGRVRAGLENAQGGLVAAKEKGAAAKSKAGGRSGSGGQGQSGRGNRP